MAPHRVRVTNAPSRRSVMIRRAVMHPGSAGKKFDVADDAKSRMDLVRG
jgi:hypothetical protein